MARVVDEIREGSVQLFDSDVHSLVSLSSDNIHDRLSLGQIDTTIEESPLGKFTWLSKTCPFADHQLQDFIGHCNPTVSIDLDNIFASEGLW